MTADNAAPTGSIVVGVDSSADSDDAVRWALSVAERTHRPVHFVHVQPPIPPYVSDERAQEAWDRAGQLVVDRALHEAELVRGVTATGSNVRHLGTATAEVLDRLSRGAYLLVVGARGHGGFAGLLMGSVSQHAARHATCPVAAVRAPADPSAERVVVGVDDSDGAQDALAIAFELAAQRKVGLTAIHAWRAPALHAPGAAVLPMGRDVGEHVAEQEEELARLLVPWQQKYPWVAVTAEVIPGHPGEVLSVASEHAALVVVGSRGRGAFAGLLLGSVGQEVLHRARCPVVVAR